MPHRLAAIGLLSVLVLGWPAVAAPADLDLAAAPSPARSRGRRRPVRGRQRRRAAGCRRREFPDGGPVGRRPEGLARRHLRARNARRRVASRLHAAAAAWHTRHPSRRRRASSASAAAMRPGTSRRSGCSRGLTAGSRSRRCPALPLPLANASAALVGSTIYVAGGEDRPNATAASRAFLSLDIETAGGGLVDSAHVARTRTNPCGRGIAGRRVLPHRRRQPLRRRRRQPMRRYLRDAYRYDPATGWTRIADLPHPLAAAPSPAPALGPSHLLLLGGDDGSRAGFQPPAAHPGFSRTVLAYHTITDTWTTMGEAAAAPVTVPSAWWNDRIVVRIRRSAPGCAFARCLDTCASSGQGGVRLGQLRDAGALSRRDGLAGCVVQRPEQDDRRFLPRGAAHPLVGGRPEHLLDDAELDHVHGDPRPGLQRRGGTTSSRTRTSCSRRWSRGSTCRSTARST